MSSWACETPAAEMAVGKPGISVLASPHRLRLLRGALGSTEGEHNKLSGLVDGALGGATEVLKQTLNEDVQVEDGYDKLLVHRERAEPIRSNRRLYAHLWGLHSLETHRAQNG